MISQKKAGGADQALLDENERIEDEWLEDETFAWEKKPNGLTVEHIIIRASNLHFGTQQ